MAEEAPTRLLDMSMDSCEERRAISESRTTGRNDLTRLGKSSREEANRAVKIVDGDDDDLDADFSGRWIVDRTLEIFTILTALVIVHIINT